MLFSRRGVVIIFLTLVIALLLMPRTHASHLAQETIQVTIQIPPMYRMDVLERDTLFSYDGNTLERLSAIELEVKINSPWKLDVEIAGLPGGVIPLVRPQMKITRNDDVHYLAPTSTGSYVFNQGSLFAKEQPEHYSDKVTIIGNQIGAYTLKFDALVPSSSNLPPGEYDLVFYFTISHILD